jgi:hypothetical protein
VIYLQLSTIFTFFKVKEEGGVSIGLFTYDDEPDQVKMQPKLHFTKIYCVLAFKNYLNQQSKKVLLLFFWLLVLVERNSRFSFSLTSVEIMEVVLTGGSVI